MDEGARVEKGKERRRVRERNAMGKIKINLMDSIKRIRGKGRDKRKGNGWKR